MIAFRQLVLLLLHAQADDVMMMLSRDVGLARGMC